MLGVCVPCPEPCRTCAFVRDPSFCPSTGGVFGDLLVCGSHLPFTVSIVRANDNGDDVEDDDHHHHHACKRTGTVCVRGVACILRVRPGTATVSSPLARVHRQREQLDMRGGRCAERGDAARIAGECVGEWVALRLVGRSVRWFVGLLFIGWLVGGFSCLRLPPQLQRHERHTHK